jgi:acetyl esterase/lipase
VKVLCIVLDDFHPDLRQVASGLDRGIDLTPTALPLVREAMADRRGNDLSDVTVVSLGDGSGVRVHRPPGLQTPAAAMLWIHGGCYVIGSAAQDDEVCRRFARTLGIVVASVEYRLAPEHPYPAALDDCAAALSWLVGQPDVDASRVAIGGASAGGGLTAALALRTRDEEMSPPVLQLLVYPMLDDRPASEPDPEPHLRRLMDQGMNRTGWDSYLRAADPQHAVPARAASLENLPPAWIGVGTLDLLFDECIQYADRLKKFGVQSALEVVPGAFHAFDLIAPKAGVSRRFFESQCAALRGAFDLSP